MKTFLAMLAGAVATAVLLVLALPPVGFWPLAWIALVPAFAASFSRGFLKGFLTGIGASLIVGWLAVEGYLYADKSFTGEATWTYLGAAMFGFVLSMVCGIVGELKKWTWRGTLGLAALTVLIELALMPILPSTIALSQARVAGMLTLASWAGIWAVAFGLWAVNLCLARALGARDRQVAIVSLSPVAALLLVGLLPSRPTSGETIRVAVVQSPSAELDVMERLSRKGNPDLAVWPEFAGLAHVQRGDATTLVQLAKSPGMPAIVTSFPDGHQPKPRNTAALFGASGESARYYKRRLFGGEKNMHVPGDKPVAAKTQWGPIALNICFDSCFPNLVRASASLGEVGIIALPTIDPESPHSFVAAIHAAFTPFRAAEMGVSVLRADGFAHSMIVDNTGRVLLDMKPRLEDSEVATVSTTPRWTVYKAIGDWFLWLCGGLLFYACFGYLRDRSAAKRTSAKQPQRAQEPSEERELVGSP